MRHHRELERIARERQARIDAHGGVDPDEVVTKKKEKVNPAPAKSKRKTRAMR